MALIFLFSCSLSQLPSMACQGLKCSGKSFRVTLIEGCKPDPGLGCYPHSCVITGWLELDWFRATNAASSLVPDCFSFSSSWGAGRSGALRVTPILEV